MITRLILVRAVCLAVTFFFALGIMKVLGIFGLTSEINFIKDDAQCSSEAVTPLPATTENHNPPPRMLSILGYIHNPKHQNEFVDWNYFKMGQSGNEIEG
ncbi:MAG TPA: hypothetical protein VHQ20_02865, partial [Patescibacteria group bacterium]|nr:hypothetical protein [Patescibacteria group bacterium]